MSEALTVDRGGLALVTETAVDCHENRLRRRYEKVPVGVWVGGEGGIGHQIRDAESPVKFAVRSLG